MFLGQFIQTATVAIYFFVSQYLFLTLVLVSGFAPKYCKLVLAVSYPPCFAGLGFTGSFKLTKFTRYTQQKQVLKLLTHVTVFMSKILI